LAAQVAPAIENAALLEKTKVIGRERETMVKELSMLFDLNKAIMTTIDLDKLLHIILTAVTMGDGFGFNRAMLFLYNKNTNYIQGMMGVGPDVPLDGSPGLLPGLPLLVSQNQVLGIDSAQLLLPVRVGCDLA